MSDKVENAASSKRNNPSVANIVQRTQNTRSTVVDTVQAQTSWRRADSMEGRGHVLVADSQGSTSDMHAKPSSGRGLQQLAGEAQRKPVVIGGLHWRLGGRIKPTDAAASQASATGGPARLRTPLASPSTRLTVGATMSPKGKDEKSASPSQTTAAKAKEKPSQPASANRPSITPPWVPPESPGWAAAIEASGLGDEEERLKTYHLASPHIFYSTGMGAVYPVTRIHNWVRIRPWCIQQALYQSAQGAALMTATEWRIALDGGYYQVPHATREDEDPQLSLRRAEDLQKLPVNPRYNDGPPREVSQKKAKPHEIRQKNGRLVSRGEINVRFGVYGGFAPYSPEDTPLWGTTEVTLEMVQNSTDLWAEIVWEVSVLCFRLELLQLDRHYCPRLYSGHDSSLARSRAVAAVWGEDGMVAPNWMNNSDVDLLCSSNLDMRRVALQRLAGILSAWPGGGSLKRLRTSWPAEGGDVRVFSFYVRAAHPVLTRLPTVPRLQPQSMRSVQRAQAY